MIDPGLVLFAIQGGAKLGRKIHDVMLDETRSRPMYIPFDYVVGIDIMVKVERFFEREENAPLLASGGPYHGASEDELIQAYQTLKTIDDTAVRPMSPQERSKTVIQMHAFSQARASLAHKPVAQRIIGTMVEIGIDYVVAYPPAGLLGSKGGKVMLAFAGALNDVGFAEADGVDLAVTLVEKVLATALDVLDTPDNGLIENKRLRPILAGIVGSYKDAFATTTDLAARDRLKTTGDLLLPSAIQGAATAAQFEMALYLGKDEGARKLVHAAVSNVLGALAATPDLEALFKQETLEGVVAAVVKTMGENPEIAANGAIVKDLIQRTARALVNGAPDGQPAFTPAAFGRILQAGLETVAAHTDELIPGTGQRTQLLTDIVTSISTGLAEGLNDPATQADVRKLMTADTLVSLAEDVFAIVAEHPERLLRIEAGSPSPRTALANVIGSVARAISTDPSALATDATYGDLMRIALAGAVQNLDLLVDLNDPSPETNALFDILKETLGATAAAPDPRGLVDRAFIRNVVAEVLPVIAARVVRYTQRKVSHPIQVAVSTTLGVASDLTAAPIGTDQIPDVIATAIDEMIDGSLDPTDPAAVRARILQLAA